MTRRRATPRWMPVAVCLMGAACSGPLPDPVVRSVTPSTFDQGQVPLLVVEVEAQLPFHADHGERVLTVDDSLRVRVGGLQAFAASAAAPGVWEVTAPFELGPGTHDLEVELADGRRGSLAEAVTVREVVLPDGFVIDPIGEQRRGVPFPITVRATGPAAPAFAGSVRLSTNRGGISPTLSAPFTEGVLTEQVTLNQVGNDLVVIVEGPGGVTASSNAFRVTP
jgi:hypothetical protein